MRQRLVIERLGHKGEGIARTAEGLVFVPFALPGETVIADIEGERAALVDISRAVAGSDRALLPAFRHMRRLCRADARAGRPMRAGSAASSRRRCATPASTFRSSRWSTPMAPGAGA